MKELLWKIIGPSNKFGRNKYARCRCRCGVVKNIRLIFGKPSSFGCHSCMSHTRTFGETGTPLHNSWTGMKQRCDYKKHIGYKDYGGRGITYHKAWASYASFREWALKNGYQEGLSLERKNVDGNYTPNNCTWIPRGDQAKNARSNIRVAHNGQTLILKDWTRKLGLNYDKIRRRIYKGKTPKQALGLE